MGSSLERAFCLACLAIAGYLFAATALDWPLILEWQDQSNNPLEVDAFIVYIEVPGEPDPVTRRIQRTFVGPVVAINAGGPALELTRLKYEADMCVTGGSIGRRDQPISNTTVPDVYKSERYGDFNYAISLDPGTYHVVLQFAEVHWHDPQKRLFNVYAENQRILENKDLTADHGARVAYDHAMITDVIDGTLDLRFESLLDNAQLCGILVFDHLPVFEYTLEGLQAGISYTMTVSAVGAGFTRESDRSNPVVRIPGLFKPGKFNAIHVPPPFHEVTP